MSATSNQVMEPPEPEAETRWCKVCVDCLERGINAHCIVLRIERSPASEPCDWCHRLTTGIRVKRSSVEVRP